jgi:hypothetical protein
MTKRKVVEKSERASRVVSSARTTKTARFAGFFFAGFNFVFASCYHLISCLVSGLAAPTQMVKRKTSVKPSRVQAAAA